MPNFTGNKIYQPWTEFSETAKHGIGELAVTSDGRAFRYVKVGAVALVVGNALQARIEDTDHDNVAVRATDAGSFELLITTGSGSGALDANEYAGGFAVIDTTPGLGYIYKIDHHAAIAASTDGILYLDKADPIQVALTTSSKVTLVRSPYNGVIQFPVTTATNICVGGAIAPITALYHGWIQTAGPGAGLIAGTPGAGLPVTAIGAVAGALTVHSGELGTVAKMMCTGRDGKVLPVQWMCEG